MKKTGIYFITNALDHKVYVGQSVNLVRRLQRHKDLLRSNRHTNAHLQRAYNKYGESNFTFKVRLECSVELLDFWEQWFIWYYRTAGMCYNLTNGGSENKTYSAESKAKMSASHKGKTPWNKGKPMSSKSKAKVSASKRGTKMPDSYMEKFVEFMKNAPRNSDGTFARRRA